MRKFRVVLLGAMLALGLLGAAAPAHGAILATEVCVTIYEDTNTGHDRWTYCALPGSAHQASLTGDTSGLSNGCQGATIQPDWNDCASMTSYSGLPGNYRIRFYSENNYNYSAPHLPYCRDANGSGGAVYIGFYMNDVLSSWRVESGNC